MATRLSAPATGTRSRMPQHDCRPTNSKASDSKSATGRRTAGRCRPSRAVHGRHACRGACCPPAPQVPAGAVLVIVSLRHARHSDGGTCSCRSRGRAERGVGADRSSSPRTWSTNKASIFEGGAVARQFRRRSVATSRSWLRDLVKAKEWREERGRDGLPVLRDCRQSVSPGNEWPTRTTRCICCVGIVQAARCRGRCTCRARSAVQTGVASANNWYQPGQRGTAPPMERRLERRAQRAQDRSPLPTAHNESVLAVDAANCAAPAVAPGDRLPDSAAAGCHCNGAGIRSCAGVRGDADGKRALHVISANDEKARAGSAWRQNAGRKSLRRRVFCRGTRKRTCPDQRAPFRARQPRTDATGHGLPEPSLTSPSVRPQPTEGAAPRHRRGCCAGWRRSRRATDEQPRVRNSQAAGRGSDRITDMTDNVAPTRRLRTCRCDERGASTAAVARRIAEDQARSIRRHGHAGPAAVTCEHEHEQRRACQRAEIPGSARERGAHGVWIALNARAWCAAQACSPRRQQGETQTTNKGEVAFNGEGLSCRWLTPTRAGLCWLTAISIIEPASPATGIPDPAEGQYSDVGEALRSGDMSTDSVMRFNLPASKPQRRRAPPTAASRARWVRLARLSETSTPGDLRDRRRRACTTAPRGGHAAPIRTARRSRLPR